MSMRTSVVLAPTPGMIFAPKADGIRSERNFYVTMQSVDRSVNGTFSAMTKDALYSDYQCLMSAYRDMFLVGWRPIACALGQNAVRKGDTVLTRLGSGKVLEITPSQDGLYSIKVEYDYSYAIEHDASEVYAEGTFPETSPEEPNPVENDIEHRYLAIGMDLHRVMKWSVVEGTNRDEASRNAMAHSLISPLWPNYAVLNMREAFCLEKNIRAYRHRVMPDSLRDDLQTLAKQFAGKH